jgi:hypothetical protein
VGASRSHQQTRRTRCRHAYLRRYRLVVSRITSIRRNQDLLSSDWRDRRSLSRTPSRGLARRVGHARCSRSGKRGI